MAGFREHMPGQVWFYYNPKATKENEKRNELGAVSSRPVVIIQAAHYAEWNDVVTVCPLTSSDRRSGVYIDSTILNDGSLIEGGTVLPYLIYTVKTKFLYPIITTNHRRRLISLSKEDWAKVRQGYLYHLGEDVPEPDYITNWKHLDDFDREIVIRDVKLAISDMEDIVKDASAVPSTQAHKKLHNLPLVQVPPATTRVENHMIASLDQYDRTNRKLYRESDCFNAAPIEGQTAEEDDTAAPTGKSVTREQNIIFTNYGTKDFANALAEITGEFEPYDTKYICEGSQYLAEADLKSMPGMMTSGEHYKLLTMTVSQIIANTGIHSASTGSRLRKALREMYVEAGLISFDDTGMITTQLQYEPFIYRGDFIINRRNVKRSMRQWRAAMSLTRAEMIDILQKPLPDVAKIANCPLSWAKQIKLNIIDVFPNEPIAKGDTTMTASSIREEIEKETASSDKGLADDKFPLWVTLSPMEVHEVRSCSKRNMKAMGKNFGISHERAKALHDQCLSKNLRYDLPTITDDDKAAACEAVITGDYSTLEPWDLLLFCKCDHPFIISMYAKTRSNNTPSKAQIRVLKSRIRRIIVSDYRPQY